MLREPTVFVVDDNAMLRKFLRRLVESAGLPVETYASAEEFLDACDPQRPGCLVLDVDMPGMSGLELQEKLRAVGVEIPVIILTGRGETPMVGRAFRAGALDFFEKPFSARFLLARIREAVAQDVQVRRQ